MSRRYAQPRRRQTATPIPGPWRFRAEATRHALLAFEERVHSWQTLAMQMDVLDDIVERYARIVADTLKKDADAARARGQRRA